MDMTSKGIKNTWFGILVVLAACSGNRDLSDAYGNFEAEDVMVAAEANGKLLLFNAEEGNGLDAGVITAVIDTTDLVIKRRQLQAQARAVSSKIESIEAQIKVQEQQKKNLLVDKERVEKLMKDGAATQKQMDDINGAIDLVDSQIVSTRTQYTQVQSELKVIGTQVEQVEESIARCHVINPITGVVLETYAEQMEVTTFGRPLYKIANLDEMILRVYVSGAQLPDVRIGQQAEVLIDAGENSNRALAGTVSWISETAEFTPKIIQTKEERVSMVYAVKIRVKNDGSLKIGMPGEANFGNVKMQSEE